MSAIARDLAANLSQVRERIEMAAARSGRRVEEITLVAVSKTHSAKKISELHEAGIRHFGENRIQEWENKKPRLPNLAATWHMIGHVQKNKAGRAAQIFDTVDSVDSIALAEKLDRARVEFASGEKPAKESRLRVLIEVKLDPEPAKSGASTDSIARLAESILRMPHLELRGLMGMPPYFENPEESRPFFRSLRELRDASQKQFGGPIFPVLSMGMSHDFEVAIEEGATEIRVGTALFGERESN